MIAGAELSAWLADSSRQKKTMGSRIECGRRLRDSDLLRVVRDDLEALKDPSAEDVQPVAERFFRKQDEISSLLAELVRNAAEDPFFSPPFTNISTDIQTGLLLFEHPLLSLAMSVTSVDALAAKKSRPRGATSIGFTGYLTLFHFIKAGGATLSFWEAPPIGDTFVQDDATGCWKTDVRRIEDGETVVMDGRHQSFVIEHATSDILYLQAMVLADPAPVAVEYDSTSLQFVGASGTDEASSRMQMMASLLRLLDREDAAPFIVDVVDGTQFHARWQIMRELLALDAEAALPKLKEMARLDSHPEVRTAALETLERFFPGQLMEGEARCRD